MMASLTSKLLLLGTFAAAGGGHVPFTVGQPVAELLFGVADSTDDATADRRPPPHPPPPPAVPMPLHPFHEYAPAGDVDGTFEFNGTFHIFKCCDFHHMSAPTAAGPWTDLGTGGSPARDGGYISGSATVVGGVPRMVMPLFRGNPRTAHCCAGADGRPHEPPWRYPCIANPPQGRCVMDYVMSKPTNLSDPQLTGWQGVANQTVLVHGSQGTRNHGYIQQDPSHAWWDEAAERWMFLGGTYINGSAHHAGGTPVLELFGSVARDDWSQGFEFLSVFSAQGLAACDPELMHFPRQNISVLYVCSNQYLIGHVVPTADAHGGADGRRFEPLGDMPAGVWGHGGGVAIEYGSGAGKGFYQAALDRHLLWMMTEGAGHGYSTAREVTVDPSLPLLLTYPAREYLAMRQPAQVRLTGATVVGASEAISRCPGHAQLDLELVHHFAAAAAAAGVGGEGGGAAAGDCIGLSVLGGGAAAVVIFKSPTVAVLHDCDSGCSCTGPRRPSKGGFLFGTKANESSVALRILVDGNQVEAFAQGGRAQISFAGKLAPHNSSGSGSAGVGWNTSVGLLSSSGSGSSNNPKASAGAGFIDVGVWPLAFTSAAFPRE
jgi:hypothetical protein